MAEEPWVDPASDAFFQRPLHEILEVRPRGQDEFAAQLDGFGGVTLGCATRAAALTSTELRAHSLHAHFLRPVAVDAPTRISVERVRDGRRIAHRRALVWNGDKLACEILVSFTGEAPGPEYQESKVPAGVPPPEEVEEDAATWRRANHDPGHENEPLRWRWLGVPWAPDEADPRSRYRGWVRPRVPLPDEPAVHAGALAFLADYHSHLPIARKLAGPYDPSRNYTSLDQTVWIHRMQAWDDWWLATSDSDLAHAGRALSRRQLHDREGRLVATMTQEMMLLGG